MHGSGRAGFGSLLRGRGNCLHECTHTLQVAHGDLKVENVMKTCVGWVVVVDMAPFKPTYIKHVWLPTDCLSSLHHPSYT